MSDIEKILWGAFGAVFVYILGQLLSKFFIDPLQELRKVMGEVRFTLSFHGATIHTPIGRSKERSDAAHEALMRNSSDIIAKLHAVPFYEGTRLLAFGALPPREALEQAAVQLRGLSTYVHETGDKANNSISVINARVEKIERLLSLKRLGDQE